MREHFVDFIFLESVPVCASELKCSNLKFKLEIKRATSHVR